MKTGLGSSKFLQSVEVKAGNVCGGTLLSRTR
jgi:hypothetical protein